MSPNSGRFRGIRSTGDLCCQQMKVHVRQEVKQAGEHHAEEYGGPATSAIHLTS